MGNLVVISPHDVHWNLDIANERIAVTNQARSI